MRRVRWFVLVALAASAVARPLAAQQQEQQVGVGAQAAEPAAASLVGQMPRSAELIVVFDGAAGMRQSAAWGVVRPALGDMTALAETWAQLAATLGWTPAEAFDRVLGSRVALVVRGLPEHGGLLGVREQAEGGAAGADGGLRWALISEVSAETERRLLERLAASPRDIVRGCPLLAVERGMYELAIYRPKKRAGAGARSTLIIGEAGKAELLDEMIGVLTDGAAAPMRGTPAHLALAGLGRADAAVLYRWPGGDGEAWSDYAAVALRRESGDEWSARLSVRDGAVTAELLRIEPTGDAAMRRLSDGALAAIVETRLAGDAAGGPETNPAGVVLHMLGVPKPVQDRLGQRQVLVAGRSDGAGKAGGVGGAGLGIAIGLEVVDVAGIAPAGDRFMAGLAASLEGGSDNGLGASPAAGVPDFGGIAPGAVRAAPLRRTPGLLRSLACGPEPATGSGAALAWVFPAHGDAGHGWWLMSAAGGESGETEGASALVRRLAAAVTADEEGERARWLSRGVLRLAALENAVGSATPGLTVVRGVLRRVEELSWGLFVNDAGAIEGTVRIKPTDPGS